MYDNNLPPRPWKLCKGARWIVQDRNGVNIAVTTNLAVAQYLIEKLKEEESDNA